MILRDLFISHPIEKAMQGCKGDTFCTPTIDDALNPELDSGVPSESQTWRTYIQSLPQQCSLPRDGTLGPLLS